MKAACALVAILLTACSSSPGIVEIDNRSHFTIDSADVILSDTFLTPGDIPPASTDSAELVRFEAVPAGGQASKQYSRSGEYYITATVTLSNGTRLTNAAGYAIGHPVHTLTVIDQGVLVDGRGPSLEVP